MKNLLKEADEFIAAHKRGVNGFYKPLYHFSPPCGWMNDPNGLVYFRGEYHLFYQFHPYDSKPGPMYWGHAKSRDLVSWEHLPVALAPDMPYDQSGCWSGGATVIGDRLYLIYTGHREENGVRCQTQNVAYSRDGILFEKYSGNPVIDAASAPEGVKKEDFRDPFVWEQDGIYYCLVGTLQNGVPTVLIYRSENFFDWEFFGVFLQREHSGYCYECPNVFHTEEGDALLLSPVDYPADGFAFANCNSVVCAVGKIDYERGRFKGGAFEEVDGGTDFYATQVVRSPDGKNILLAWLNLWNRTMVTDELGHGWQGMLTLPREVSVREGRLRQKPAASLLSCLETPVVVEDEVRGEKSYESLSGRTLRLRVRADVSSCRSFGVKLFSDGTHYLSAVYDTEKRIFTLDRTRARLRIKGHEREREGVRSLVYEGRGDLLELEIWLDKCSAEIFLGDGEAVMSMLVYDGEGEGISFFADGRAKLRAERSRIVLPEDKR